MSADPAQLRHSLGKSGPTEPPDLVRLAKRLGARAKATRVTIEKLQNTPLPAIALGRDGAYFLIGAVREDAVLVQGPATAPQRLTFEELSQVWSGQLILLTTRADLPGGAKFDVTWFIPALVKYRGLLGEVLLASFVLQLFALATPMIFQVVIDKVLVHHSLTTLDVLAIGLIAVVTFDAVLGGLRAYLFTHTTSRVDVELGAKRRS
ncbi:MAG: cysteine peptidase family C39 domain-containing protein [Phenylobacterium sp.]|nr:cysteine peptidase family C39 domain-containing protein [Phenylobacterium sp.]MDP3747075.1 cysteine peptidase family C39 domain-containing protein [Phenylobacterium sp.]